MDEKVKKRISPLWFVIPLGIIVLGFLCYVPFWINSAYLKGGDYQTVWSGSELLAFYGALLSALGAIFLGALSIWQNKQIQKSNEAAQARLERINNYANEISVLNKIVEHEKERINGLNNACQDFLSICEDMNWINGVNSKEEITAATARIRVELIHTHDQALHNITCSVFKVDCHDTLIKTLNKAFEEANQFYTIYNDTEQLLNYDTEVLTNALSDLFSVWNRYIFEMNKTIKRVILEDVSLQDIREAYAKVKEEEQNG